MTMFPALAAQLMASHPTFDPARYQPYADKDLAARSPEYTAEGKAQFARQLATFALAGFPASKWTKRLYGRLSLSFNHIAEHDQGGFFHTWFADARRRLAWVEHILAFRPYGDPTYTYSDVERDFQHWLAASGLRTALQRQVANATETAERAELARLKAKYDSGTAGMLL